MSADKHLLERLYASYASTHAGLGDRSSHFLSYRRDIAPHLPEDTSGRVLDVGCGQGRVVQHLTRAGWSGASGIDISPEQVAIAHASGLHSVRCGDYRSVLSEPSTYSAVIATDLIEHLDRAEVVELFDLVRAALVPGGVFIVRCPNGSSPFFGSYQYSDFTHITAIAPRSFSQLASIAGFQAVATFDCPPIAHGLTSALRAAVWRVGAAGVRLMLTAETGARGHLVAQNFVGVARV